MWTVSTEGEEIARLRPSYPNVEEDEWEEVVRTSAKILGQCPHPDSPPGTRRTGLAIGKIQSGKTLSYTALIALGVDNGYRVSVVLAGTKNPLRQQSFDRLKHDLTYGRWSVAMLENPTAGDLGTLRQILQSGRHALIIVLKHRGRIDNLTELLSAPEVRRAPTLVIDDEGDEAGLNNQFRRGRRSAIYSSILDLRDALDVHAYLPYTATPQANLLISDLDALAPDFAVLVDPGHDYTGGAVFFGENRDQYVRELPPGEEEFDPADPAPSGLRQALALFAVGGTVRHMRSPHVPHSMVVHNSSYTRDHSMLFGGIASLLDGWRDTMTNQDGDEAKSELVALFKTGYDDLCRTIRGPPPWEEVKARLLPELWEIQPMMVNSLPQGKDPILEPPQMHDGLLVGGNMLARGLTIDGLAVTYITRRARGTQADTMEQRARFFGYKKSYLDLCRVYLTHQLNDDYTRILNLENDLWEHLKRNENQGMTIREWNRMFALDMSMGLKPTRASVANFRQFMGSGWEGNIQFRPVEDEPRASKNLRAIQEFFASCTGNVRSWGTTSHLVVDSCPTDKVVSELLARVDTEGTDWEGQYNKEYLTRLLLRGSLPSIQVVLMNQGRVSQGEVRHRTKENGRIKNLMQGSNKSPGDPDYYPGDREFHNGQAQLQVHVILLEGEVAQPVLTTALALHIPEGDPRYNLAYVVRGDEYPLS